MFSNTPQPNAPMDVPMADQQPSQNMATPSLPTTTSNPSSPTPTPPSYPTPPPSSLPGHDLDADGGDGSGGWILGSKQVSRASPPIAGAPASGQPEAGVSHSPTRLPWCPDTAQAIARSSSLPDQSLSSSSPLPSSNNSSIPQVRVQHVFAPGDDPSENFTPQGGNPSQNCFAIIGNHLLHLHYQQTYLSNVAIAM